MPEARYLGKMNSTLPVVAAPVQIGVIAAEQLRTVLAEVALPEPFHPCFSSLARL